MLVTSNFRLLFHDKAGAGDGGRKFKGLAWLFMGSFVMMCLCVGLWSNGLRKDLKMWGAGHRFSPIFHVDLVCRIMPHQHPCSESR